MKEKICDIKKRIFNLVTFFMISIYPFLVVKTDYYSDLPNYPWYFGQSHQLDYFIQFRSWIIIAIGMLLLCLIIHDIKKNMSFILFLYIFYAFAILCAFLVAENKRVAVIGGIEQHESIFVLWAYLIISVYYGFNHEQLINYTKTITFYVQIFILTNFLLFLAIVQKKEVYLTMYNPDYASLYLLMLLVVWFILLNYSKNRKNLCCGIIGTFETCLSIILTGCITNMVLMILLLLIVFIRKVLKDRGSLNIKIIYGLASLFLIFQCTIFVVGFTDNLCNRKVVRDYINTCSDSVEVCLNGKINRFITGKETNHNLNYKRAARLIDSKYIEGFTIDSPYEEMFFTYDEGINSYVYINSYEKAIVLKPADRCFFKTNDDFLGRGYIWSIAIHLVKKYGLLGCGPDNFTYVFPHNNYMGELQAGYLYSLITKPHSLFLQILIQTGIVSLLVFWLLNCIAIKKAICYMEESNIEAFWIVVAIIIYLISGIMNDSCVVTAPYYWMMLGMMTNYKYK